MKKLAIFVFTILILFTAVNADDRESSHEFSFGFQLNRFQDDFGFGANLTSPYFANSKIAVRLRGNIMFFEHAENQETLWTPYPNLSLGLIGVAGKAGESIRLYGEGGVIFIFPSNKFSSDNVVLGGYGGFGFEFFISSKTNYYIEIGGIGTGATADNILNKPIYSNGLSICSGFRTHF